jgi:hypothetical protein
MQIDTRQLPLARARALTPTAPPRAYSWCTSRATSRECSIVPRSFPFSASLWRLRQQTVDLLNFFNFPTEQINRSWENAFAICAFRHIESGNQSQPRKALPWRFDSNTSREMLAHI